jgi:hypothetical protein
VPCSRKARPATMRVMPRICDEYRLRKSIQSSQLVMFVRQA